MKKQFRREGDLPDSRECYERRLSELAVDLADLKRIQARLSYDAQHDTLTSLPNRALFIRHLEQMLYYSERHPQTGVAVLFVDLDGFRAVNDGLGHSAGDEVLTAVANRMQQVLNPGDLVARHGGDEFVVALNSRSKCREAEATARRVLRAIRKPVVIGDLEIVVKASIGVACTSTRRTVAADLLHDAGIAMYMAKDVGGNTCVLFKPSMALSLLRPYDPVLRLPDLRSSLRGAFERNELELHYQPVHNLANRRLAGVEALLRWRRGNTLCDPIAFLDAAEEAGLMNEIGPWVFRSACREIPENQNFYVSVNVTPSQFFDVRFLQHISDTLVTTGLPPARFVVEISEAIVLRNPAISARLLNGLHEIGAGVQIDEFGANHSVLNRLLEWPISALKISRDVMGAMDDKNRAARVVGAVVQMAHSMGCNIVATGIETANLLKAAKRAGCDLGQGYYLTPPASACDLFSTSWTGHTARPQQYEAFSRMPQ